MTHQEAINKFSEHCKERIADAEKVKDAFIVDLNRDPAYTMEWSDRMFRAAAQIKVCSPWIIEKNKILKDHDDLKLTQIRDHFHSLLCTSAKNGSHSNVVTNHLRSYELSIVTEEYEYLNWLCNRIS